MGRVRFQFSFLVAWCVAHLRPLRLTAVFGSTCDATGAQRSGTHLTSFAHGVGLPAKVFHGFMHHCDWVATIVEGAAKSKLLPDGDGTPMDSINMWDTLMDSKEVSESPRKDVVMNIDPTNQGDVENDPGGWAGAQHN